MFFYQAGWFQKLSGFDVNQIFPINKEITVNSTRTFQLTQEGFKNLPEFYLNFNPTHNSTNQRKLKPNACHGGLFRDHDQQVFCDQHALQHFHEISHGHCLFSQ